MSLTFNCVALLSFSIYDYKCPFLGYTTFLEVYDPKFLSGPRIFVELIIFKFEESLIDLRYVPAAVVSFEISF